MKKYLVFTKLLYNPFHNITNFLELVSTQPTTFFIIIFIISSAIFSYYPIHFLIEKEKPPTTIWDTALKIFEFVVFIAMSNLFHTLFVDIICDFRIKKKAMIRTLLSMMGISAISSLLMAIALEASVLFFRNTESAIILLVILVVFWQWLIEALCIRKIYTINFATSIILEICGRIFSTTSALILISIITGEIKMLMGYLT